MITSKMIITSIGTCAKKRILTFLMRVHIPLCWKMFKLPDSRFYLLRTYVKTLIIEMCTKFYKKNICIIFVLNTRYLLKLEAVITSFIITNSLSSPSWLLKQEYCYYTIFSIVCHLFLELFFVTYCFVMMLTTIIKKLNFLIFLCNVSFILFPLHLN